MIFHRILIHEQCSLYGFNPTPENIEFLETTNHEDFIWELIASGSYSLGTSKLSIIRNPMIRIMVRALSNTMFAKEESGMVRHDEIMMIHHALASLYQRSSMHHTSLYRRLTSRKSKVERIGSRLLPSLITTGCSALLMIRGRTHMLWTSSTSLTALSF